MFNITILALAQSFSSSQYSFSLYGTKTLFKPLINLQSCSFNKKINPILFNQANYNISSSSFNQFLSNAIYSDSNEYCSPNTITSNPTRISGCIFRDFRSSVITIIETSNNLDIIDTFFVNCISRYESLILVSARKESIPTFSLKFCCFINSTSYGYSSSTTISYGIICTIEVQIFIEHCSLLGHVSNNNNDELNPVVKHSHQKFFILESNITSHKQINYAHQKTLFDISAYKDYGKDVDIRQCSFGYNTGNNFISVIEYSSCKIEDSLFINNTNSHLYYDGLLFFIGNPIYSANGNDCYLHGCAFANNDRINIFSLDDKVERFSVQNNMIDRQLLKGQGNRIYFNNNHENCLFDPYELENWHFIESRYGIDSRPRHDTLYKLDVECRIYIQTNSTKRNTTEPSLNTTIQTQLNISKQTYSITPKQTQTEPFQHQRQQQQTQTASEQPLSSDEQTPTPSSTVNQTEVGGIPLLPPAEMVQAKERSVDKDKDKKVALVAFGVVAGVSLIVVAVFFIIKHFFSMRNVATVNLIDSNAPTPTTYTNNLHYSTDDPFASDFIDESTQNTHRI